MAAAATLTARRRATFQPTPSVGASTVGVEGPVRQEEYVAVSDAVEVPPPTGDQLTLNYLRPWTSFHKTSDSYYVPPLRCFNGKEGETGGCNRVYPPELTGHLWPADMKDVKLMMAAAAGLMLEPDVAPEDYVVDGVVVDDPVKSLSKAAAKKLSNGWGSEMCCRATIMSTPRIGGVISHKKPMIVFRTVPTTPIVHQAVMDEIERTYGYPVFPFGIYAAVQNDHLRDYAHNILHVSLWVASDVDPATKEPRINTTHIEPYYVN